LRISYRVGSRHPLSLGAAGIAILAGRPEADGDSEAVREARRLGYSVTRGQLQRGAVGVACPLHGKGRRASFEASIGVVALDDLDVARAADAVRACARKIADAISSTGSEPS
jgi:DNA-binding IclR family transcriptional regulator